MTLGRRVRTPLSHYAVWDCHVQTIIFETLWHAIDPTSVNLVLIILVLLILAGGGGGYYYGGPLRGRLRGPFRPFGNPTDNGRPLRRMLCPRQLPTPGIRLATTKSKLSPNRASLARASCNFPQRSFSGVAERIRARIGRTLRRYTRTILTGSDNSRMSSHGVGSQFLPRPGILMCRLG
jgi:hypothetical protein